MGRTPLTKAIKRLFGLAVRSVEDDLPLKELLEKRDETRYNRRQLMKTALSAAATLPAAALAQKLVGPTSSPKPSASASPTPTKASGEPPVVILGGGLAGLSTAYFLSNHNIPCVIYEASDRTGGRVYTRYNFGNQKQFTELGAEFVDTGNKLLIGLCDQLGLSTQDINETSNKDLDVALVIDGTPIEDATVGSAFLPLAEQLIVDRKPLFKKGKMITPTFKNPMGFERFDKMSITEYLDSKKDVDPVLKKIITSIYTFESAMEADKQSAMNFLVEVETDTDDGVYFLGESDQAKRITGGNSSIVERLADVLNDRSVAINRNQPLIGIKDKMTSLDLVFKTDGGSVTVNAKRVICTIPLNILRQIDGIQALGFSPQKKKYINELGYGTGTKVSMGFKSRFWRKSANHLPAFSDLITNSACQTIWDSTLGQEDHPGGILTNLIGGQAGKIASSENIEVALKALTHFHPETRAEYLGNKSVKNWYQDPWHQGSYCGTLVNQFIPLKALGSVGPDLNGRFIFAGEHAAFPETGFMESAVESGLRAARVIIKEANKSKSIRW